MRDVWCLMVPACGGANFANCRLRRRLIPGSQRHHGPFSMYICDNTASQLIHVKYHNTLSPTGYHQSSRAQFRLIIGDSRAAHGIIVVHDPLLDPVELSVIEGTEISSPEDFYRELIE